MFGLKGKTLLFFVITTLLLSGVGVYFFVSITDLRKKVKTQFEPQQQTRLLKSLTLDVNNLNNQYLNDSLQLSSNYIDSIIQNVEDNISKIKLESKKIKSNNNDNLDTIPLLLRELKQKNFQLKDLRNSGENDFVFSLEKVIQNEFKNKLLSGKDSIVVTNQITSYIRENKILLDRPLGITEDAAERGFFQRMFKSKDKKKEAKEPEIVLEKRVPVFLDTTTLLKVDTANQLKVEKSKIDLMTLFDKIQQRRDYYTNTVQMVEKEIFELNYDINKKIEVIINDFILQQYVSYEAYLAELKKETGQQTAILLIAIIGFIFFSIALIFRFFKDINRNVEYQKSLKLKEEQAIRHAEEKQRFLNTMSHEIRTPLTSIIGFADMLDGDDKRIRAIKSSANYLYQMTNEILDIAKINMGIIEINPEAIDLKKTLNEIRDHFIPTLESKGLTYTFDIPENPVYIKTDGQRVQQILYNLIHNSIKFTTNGFVNLQVKVKDIGANYQVVFQVVDSGIGMTLDEQVNVFQDFQQAGTHKSKMKGTGLGLGIVEKLVNLLNGKLDLKSEPDKGTSFTLSFDFDKALAESEKNQFKPVPSLFNQVFEGKSFLIIDDDVLITSLYERILIPTNANLTIFNNPKEAFATALHENFDLLIIDYKMPEMTGYQFLNYLKGRKEKTPKTIICTANAMLDEEAKSELKAFDKVIFKPFNKQHFLNEIADILDVKLAFSNVEIIENISKSNLSFDSLKNYVGENPTDLIEVLEVIVAENNKSLIEFRMAIQNQDRESIAFVIHQLTSRFSQVDQSLTVETHEIETDLRNLNTSLNLKNIQVLYDQWLISQKEIESSLQKLKDKH